MAVIHDDAANPLTVYRVQNQHGVGPFAAADSDYYGGEPPGEHEWTGGAITTDKLKVDGLWGPRRDLSYADWKDFIANHGDVRFGSESEEQARKWMEEAGYSNKDNGGYQIVPVLARKVWRSRSGNQVFFLPHEPTEKGELEKIHDEGEPQHPEGDGANMPWSAVRKDELVEELESLEKAAGIKTTDDLVRLYRKVKPKRRDAIIEALRSQASKEGPVADVAARHMRAAKEAKKAEEPLDKTDFDPNQHPRDPETGEFVATDPYETGYDDPVTGEYVRHPDEVPAEDQVRPNEQEAYAAKLKMVRGMARFLPKEPGEAVAKLRRMGLLPKDPERAQRFLEEAGVLTKAEAGKPLSPLASRIQEQTFRQMVEAEHDLEELPPNAPKTINEMFSKHKWGPHDPHSYILRYFIHRLENADAYDTAEGSAAADADFVKRRDTAMSWAQVGPNKVAAQHPLKALHSYIVMHPHMLDDLVDHQRQLHDYVRKQKFRGEPVVRMVNGVESIPLMRGLSTGVRRDDPVLASYADSPQAMGGRITNQFSHWVPLRNVWFSFNFGDPSTFDKFKRKPHQHEWLVSPHKLVHAQPTDVREIVEPGTYALLRSRDAAEATKQKAAADKAASRAAKRAKQKANETRHLGGLAMAKAELYNGISHEMREHPQLGVPGALLTAKQHLAEDPHYYSKLDSLEESGFLKEEPRAHRHNLHLPPGSAWKGRVKVIEPATGKVSWHSVRAGQYKSGDGHSISARLPGCPSEDEKAQDTEQAQRNSKQSAQAS